MHGHQTLDTLVPSIAMTNDLRAAMIGVNTTLILITSLAVACRIIRKFRMVSEFSWHDGTFLPDTSINQLY